MRKVILFLILVVSVSFSQKVKVTFEVRVNKLPDTSAIYITGNHSELGDWNPAIKMLNKKSDLKWSTTLEFEKGTSLEYKFTLGSWNKEALKKEGKASANSKLIVNNDTTVFAEVNAWGENNVHSSFKGQITGTVRYHQNMTGNNIKPRDIIVWLPPDYVKEENKRYPVLYAHDGQNLFDPNTSAFRVDWQMDEASDSLIRKGKLDPFIIVGIYNTPDRSREYRAGDTGFAYMDFVVKKLKPFIDKNYRTLTDRNNTASIGSSAGGTISFLLLMMHNDVFGKAACLSPAFKYEGKDFVSPFRSMSSRPDVRLYMDDGGVGIDSLLLPGIEEMILQLKGRGYKEQNDFTFYFDKEAEHNESAWARRLWRPLTYLFGKE